MGKRKLVLVFGATGQQGGATAKALVENGWLVRALLRDTSGKKAKMLATAGIEIVPGNLHDRVSLEAAMSGAYGVFSVQPSSGQPQHGVSDADEFQFGTDVADAAKAVGVEHLVYSSVAGAAPALGLGHFESKWCIEGHIRSIGVNATILRPAPFMEILLGPYFGLAQGELRFFAAPMQFIAVEDIGRIAERVFAESQGHIGRTFEIAGDALFGNKIATMISGATGRAIQYNRIPGEVLRQVSLFKRIVELVDDGTLVGGADIDALRRLHPGLLTIEAWLKRTGARR
jgi:uncharacterized protein YbjT (DUF2867 family)